MTASAARPTTAATTTPALPRASPVMSGRPSTEVAPDPEHGLRLLAVVAFDHDLEQVRALHAGHHVGLERDLARLSRRQRRRTDDGLERSAPLQDAHAHVLDAQWGVADVGEGEGIADFLAQGHVAEVHAGGR